LIIRKLYGLRAEGSSFLQGHACFEKAPAVMDTLVSIDKAIKNWEELEHARLCVCILDQM